MARLVEGPVIGRMVSAPDESEIACAVGEAGVLTLHESERKHPGKSFATLYYTPGAVPGGRFDTERFARTECGELRRFPGGFAIAGTHGEYVFECDRETAEPAASIGRAPLCRRMLN